MLVGSVGGGFGVGVGRPGFFNRHLLIPKKNICHRIRWGVGYVEIHSPFANRHPTAFHMKTGFLPRSGKPHLHNHIHPMAAWRAAMGRPRQSAGFYLAPADERSIFADERSFFQFTSRFTSHMILLH